MDANDRVHTAPRAPFPAVNILLSGAIPLALALTAVACGETARAGSDLPAGTVTHYGADVPMGEGLARTYLVVENGVPIELGVALSEPTLRSLPEDGAPGGMVMPDGHSTFEYVLPMPEGSATPFQHVLVDWNPAGHEPPGIYDLPHVDVHFYTIPESERHMIHPEDPEFMAKGGRLPDEEFRPEGYVVPDGVPPVPMMGLHWLDPSSPELHPEAPEPFTRTFIYGSWDGRLIFAEPMITREFLESRPDVRTPIGVAARYEPAGYYPGSYTVRWDEQEREYRIALTDLAWRD